MFLDARKHTPILGWLTVAMSVAPAAAQIPTLTLNSDQTCYQPGDTVIVTVNMGSSAEEICGAQMFLKFDQTRLEFVSMVPSNEGPFSFQLFEFADQEQGLLTYAVSQLPTCSSPSTGPVTVAIITFTAIENCIPFLEFLPHDPPTLVTTIDGDPIEPVLVDMASIKFDDGSVPIAVCPDTIVVCADPDTLEGVADWVVTDGCAAPLDANCDATNGGAFPMGTTTIVCTATEMCGLSDSCSFDVIVVDAIPDTGPGDSNGDLVVDLSDFIDFAGCVGGPGLPPPPDPTMCAQACLSAFDGDADSDIDLLDFGTFQAVFTGS